MCSAQPVVAVSEWEGVIRDTLIPSADNRSDTSCKYNYYAFSADGVTRVPSPAIFASWPLAPAPPPRPPGRSARPTCSTSTG